LISGSPDREIASSIGTPCLMPGLADAVAWPLVGACVVLRMSGWPRDIGV